jgi:VWFA-related protein
MKVLVGFRYRLILALSFCLQAGVCTATAKQSPAAVSGPVGPVPGQTAQNAGVTSGRPDAAQEEPSDDQEPSVTIQTTTRRVVVDVVVTGPDGKPVPDLTQEDFAVFEDRKPQPVRAFEVHTPEEDRSELPPAPSELPRDTFVNLEQTPASGPPVLVLLDFLNSEVTDQIYALEQILRFLERKPPSMEVAIFALGDNLSLVQGFTTDTGKLLAAMRSKAAQPHLTAANEDVLKAQTTLDAFLDIGRFLATVNGRKNLLWFSESFDMMVLPKASDLDQGTLITDYEPGSPNPGPGPTMTSANLIPTPGAPAGTVASASGFSHGIGDMMVLREEMRKVATALAVSQTAVYPIDVRGLHVDPGLTASAASPSVLTADPKGILGTPGMPSAPGAAPASVQSHNDFMQSLDAAHATMAEIAQATGGHAFVNTNGIAAAATRAVSDGAAYYTLVYAPSNMKFDGGLRSIHVTLDKPGYTLSYRSAYYAVDPATVAPETDRDDSLAAAIVHGAPQAQGLLFKAQIDPAGAPIEAAPDSPLAAKAAISGGKTTKKPRHLSGMVQPYGIRLAILADQIQLTAMPDGRRHAALDIEICAYAADGQKLGGTSEKLEASLPPAVYQQALENGMFHTLHVELPVEAASLRLAIVDSGSHRTGSLEVPLPLPPTQQADGAAPATSISPEKK